MGRMAVFMAAVIMGTVLGFLSGLGVGGGSLLMLWLTLGMGMAQTEARVINLMFFIPSAAVACLFRWKQGRLKVTKILPAVVAGSMAAAVFTLLGQQLDTSLLKKLFGGLLISTGIREVLYKPKER